MSEISDLAMDFHNEVEALIGKNLLFVGVVKKGETPTALIAYVVAPKHANKLMKGLREFQGCKVHIKKSGRPQPA